MEFKAVRTVDFSMFGLNFSMLYVPDNFGAVQNLILRCSTSNWF